jgi:YqaJ-like viral recombinase domain
MKIHSCIQKEVEWYKLRIGKVTASECSNLLTPKWKLRDGETPKTYLCEKLAEIWQGHPLPGFTAFATEQGNILEDEALPWFRWEYDQLRVHHAGFVESDDGLSGCSPDALIGDDGGLEIKCPQAQTHVKYLLNGTLPDDYVCQVHFSMYVTGRPWWMFLSYRRKFPQFVIKVPRDEAAIAAIDKAVKKFHADLSAAKATLQRTHES